MKAERLRQGAVVWFGLLAGCLATAVGAADGPALFTVNCANCHGKDGKAQTPIGRKLGAKDLSVSTLADDDIKRQIRGGKRDAGGKQLMPAFEDRFSDEEITALVAAAKSFRKKAVKE